MKARILAVELTLVKQICELVDDLSAEIILKTLIPFHKNAQTLIKVRNGFLSVACVCIFFLGVLSHFNSAIQSTVSLNFDKRNQPNAFFPVLWNCAIFARSMTSRKVSNSSRFVPSKCLFAFVSALPMYLNDVRVAERASWAFHIILLYIRANIITLNWKKETVRTEKCLAVLSGRVAVCAWLP